MGEPRKVWVVCFAEGGVVQEPQVYETERGAGAAVTEFANAVHARWDDKAEDWDFSDCDDDARKDEVPILPGFVVR